MLQDIVEARVGDGYRLYVRFEDGRAGEVDLAEIIRFEGVFAPLKNRDHFVKVSVNRELGIVEWPCGADLDPDVLYARVTYQPLPRFTNQVISA